MTEPRIYFVTSAWEDPWDPSTKICYWEEGTGIVQLDSTNTRFELGTGRIARNPTTGEIVVSGMRWERHYNSAGEPLVEGDDGTWWVNADANDSLTEDVLLYVLDKDLQGPARVLAEDFVGSDNYPPGFHPQTNTEPYSSDGCTIPFVDPNYGIFVVGDRHREWTETDHSMGDIFHLFDEDGNLIKRDWPKIGAYGVHDNYAGPDHLGYDYLEAFSNWAAYDHVRGYAYTYVDWSSLARYNLETGYAEWAPATFMWPQTLSGQQTEAPPGTDYVRFKDPNPNNTRPWGYITRTSGAFWRSRLPLGFDVDPETGYVWCLINAWLPSMGQYCYDIPPLEVGGWRGEPDHKWQLVCLDPDLLNWTPIASPTEDVRPLWNIETTPTGVIRHGWSKAPQHQAEVAVIDLSHGQNHYYYTIACGPGVAYVVGEDYDGATEEEQLTKVEKIDLNTGERSLVFRDDRIVYYEGDPDPYYLSPWNGIFQLVLGEFPGKLKGRFLESRRGFKGRLSS